mmetsp:Transcript_39179/g.85235  ORF Transcript_39179/g.85235 Transcript_39179/m.85235 type:complete len:274 (-) Transcript_39179:1380-2201(-)|eukprot:CAMPEP_0118931802 /NCGR_PEP_ID=MMETSP1169-20130426/8014_1 /TAXON_ID=36882 /ORGANISM="Pyramimonas obovata, Strain CCMP722" /LENGTH=273 /DNA_ID=CAMNT_0006874345 /DNA_START=198 /DNA_END=1019 /DNA_ORIENTATION=-
MAANFWESSHSRMLFSPEDVLASNPKDRDAGLTPEEIRQIKEYHVHYLTQLGRAAKIRQRVVATAVVYFRRFYLRNSFVEHDPRLTAPGCLYLASKAEESTVHARHLAQVIRKCRKETLFWFEVKDILEMEMILLEDMAFSLAICHPYRPLPQLLQDAGLSDALKDAWSLLNDSYSTEVCLMHYPHVIAIAAVFLTGVTKGKRAEVEAWVAGLTVDQAEVALVVEQLLLLYAPAREAMPTRDCIRLLEQVHAGALRPPRRPPHAADRPEGDPA